MGFVKVQKNKAYYMRMQTKYRRRREGKTDYFARRKLVTQDKNKYNTPKYRLVARITGTRIICQVVYSTIQGDRVLTQATSTELEKYGIPCCYKNYAACYATGLLIARRALQKVGLDKEITGVEEADAEDYHVEEEEHDRRPFKVILDVGLTRTISGSRVFGILKGAVDGGLHVPHNTKKFPGYKEPEERGEPHEYDASEHLHRINGVHIQEYMTDLEEEDPERYKVQFKHYLDNDKGDEAIEQMYKDCHEAIRADPAYVNTDKAQVKRTRNGNEIVVVSADGSEVKYTRKQRLNCKERKDKVKQKMQSAFAKMMGGADEEEE